MYKLFEQFKSSTWEVKLEVADKIAKLNSEEGNLFLVEQLESDDVLTRNAAALGIRETHNNYFLEPLMTRITSLGLHENIGTLVYALENLNCSNQLVHIIALYINGSAEVKMSTSTILQEQEFNISKLDKENIDLELKKDNQTLDGLKIKYSIK